MPESVNSTDLQLPVLPPIKPMVAKRATKMPAGDDWMYEPKWDGFRALVFRDGDRWYIQSRDGKPLRRYFPELGEALLEHLPPRCVLDGELVIAGSGQLDFVALQNRLHPAASRVNKLAAETPASLVFFDMLALGDRSLMETPFAERRRLLEEALGGCPRPLYVTPLSRDREQALEWFHRFEGAGLDGIVAKDPASPYTPNKRVMVKVKHVRTVECVVAGFRWHKNGPGTHVGSLMLALYDEAGKLHHIGVAGAFSNARRQELVEVLEPYRKDALDGHPWASWNQASRDGGTSSGGGSRWNPGKALNWEALRPQLVAEVKYDQMLGKRFRHTGHFLRWRADKPPEECRYDQLDVTPPAEIADIFGTQPEE